MSVVTLTTSGQLESSRDVPLPPFSARRLAGELRRSPSMGVRSGMLLHTTVVRYVFAIALVTITFALGLWLTPLTGMGPPFLLFFAPILAATLFAGVGPGICAVVLSLCLKAYTFSMGGGYSVVQASFQSLLFAIDGTAVVYLTFLTRKWARSHQNTNRQLHESEAKYRTLFESIDEGFCVIEVLFDDRDTAVDYRILEVNRSFERQSGIADAAGRSIREIVPAIEEYWFEIYGHIALTGEPRRFENRIRALGRVFDVYAFRVGKPEQRHVAILFTDITTRKQAEAELHRTQVLNQSVLGSLTANIAVLDGKGNIIAVNDAWKRFAYENNGAAVADTVGVNYLQVCSDAPDGSSEGWAALNGIQAVLNGTRRSFELEYPCHSPHEKRWFLMSVAPLRGEPGGAVVTHTDITTRKRAEEGFRAVSAELRQTLHIAGAGLTHCSRDLRYLSANPAYAAWIGRPLNQIVGRPIVEVMGQPAFEIIRPRIERVLNGERVEFEDELPIAGERKCVQVVYTPDRDASGAVVGWVGSVMDISARKRIEEALKAANASLDAIIDNIPLMLFMKESQSFRFVRVNRAGEELLGWPRQLMIGKTDYDLWPKAQADFFVDRDRETLKSGTVLDVPEEPVQTRHQGVRLVHTKKVPILDTTGQPIYLLGLSEDITEKRRSEKEQQFLAEVNLALSASLDYEQTLATLAHLVVRDMADWCAVDVTDERGRLTRLKIACSDPAQAALCAVLEQMPPDRDLPHFVRSVSEGGRSVLVEHVTSEWVESFAQTPEHLQAVVATGVISLIAVPLAMRGQPLGVLMFGSSTLSHVFGQGDLRLAEAVADRAAVSIENARLYRSSVHATQIRDQVLGVVAHDLRNPLSAILMQTSVLRLHGSEQERRSKAMQVIERTARRMNRLIQDLLDVAVIESGQLPMERAQLSTSELIVEAADAQRPLASSSSLDLRIEADSNVPGVWGDRHRLLQVFENLIGNAIKFTKAGGCITVGAASRDHEVIFRVADTGSGIPPEHLPRVFDRFWQATRENRQGAGLGLPITKGIVEAHGGRIWVESTPGRGTTFSFTIPQASREQGRPSKPSGSPHLEGDRAA